MESIELIVILEIEKLEDKQVFEKHVIKEGFERVDSEEFVYTAKSSTTMFATKAYILEVFKKGLQKTDFEEASLIFLLNETAYPAYTYDKKTNDFEVISSE